METSCDLSLYRLALRPASRDSFGEHDVELGLRDRYVVELSKACLVNAVL